MAGQKIYEHLCNVGVVDADKEHRVDLDRMRLATRDQTNLIPDVAGKCSVRPGLQYLAANYNSGKARLIAFVAGQTAAYQLELTDQRLRVRLGATDGLVTRAAVTAVVQNGTVFGASTGWTLAATSGQTSTIASNLLQLSARAHGVEASAINALTINEIGTEHALRIVVARGPITFRLGSSSGGDEYITETTLRTGTHSLAFTPTGGTVYIRFSNILSPNKTVSMCQVEAAGVMSLPAIWAAADLPLIRWDQSLDVMYLGARGYRQQRIERRGDTSWSLCDYTTDDGPFLLGRTANVTLIPSVIEGNGTLTASQPFFQARHVGAIFYLFHEGQRLDTYLAGAVEFTNTIEVTGVNEPNYNDRDWTYTIAGTWAGTLKVQRSFDDEDEGFQEFRYAQASATIAITSNGTSIDDDDEDNAITWYRLGFETGLYTSGEAHVTAQYGGGGGFGVCRITAIDSTTVAEIEVLSPFLGNYATDDWREGAWSAVQGYPSAVAFTEGRLVWGGDDKVWASVSDAYESFDETITGDSAPLLRSIAIGGRNSVQWMLNLSGFVMGCDSQVVGISANSIGDAITPTNFKISPLSKVGGAPVPAVALQDNRGLYAQKAGSTLYELSFAPYPVSAFIATQFSRLNNEMFAAGISDMAISLLPDQRIWIMLNGANPVLVVYDNEEKVVAFIPIATDTGDVIESVCVLPGTVQDRVYFSVSRVVNGQTVHYTEKLALDSEAKPQAVTKALDSFLTGTGAHSTTINLPHLIGRTVYAWVDGAPVETSAGSGVLQSFLVDNSGNIVLPSAPTQGWCVGLTYPWVFETARLEYGVPNSTPMLNIKSIGGLSILFADYVRSGIKVGTRDADGNLPSAGPASLPSSIRGKTATNVVTGLVPNEAMYAVPGGASLDQRLRISGQAPYVASILALVFNIENYGG